MHRVQRDMQRRRTGKKRFSPADPLQTGIGVALGFGNSRRAPENVVVLTRCERDSYRSYTTSDCKHQSASTQNWHEEDRIRDHITWRGVWSCDARVKNDVESCRTSKMSVTSASTHVAIKLFGY